MSSLKSSAPPSSIALVSEGGMGFEFWMGVRGHIAPMTSTRETDVTGIIPNFFIPPPTSLIALFWGVT